MPWDPNRARKFRERTTLDHAAVASVVGRSASAVREWENDSGKVPGGDALIRLAALYSVRAEDFFTEYRDPQLPSTDGIVGVALNVVAADTPKSVLEQAEQRIKELNALYRATRGREQPAHDGGQGECGQAPPPP